MLWSSIDGFFGNDDAKLYEYWADIVPDNSVILEIGSYKGKSTICLLEHLLLCKKRYVKIISIDLFKVSSAKNLVIAAQPILDEFTRQRDGIVFQNLETIEGDSTKLWSRFKPDSFWGCFIDSSHDYWSTKREIEEYWPLLQVGGHMGFHDFSSAWIGVIQAVSEEFWGRTDFKRFGACIEFTKTTKFIPGIRV